MVGIYALLSTGHTNEELECRLNCSGSIMLGGGMSFDISEASHRDGCGPRHIHLMHYVMRFSMGMDAEYLMRKSLAAPEGSAVDCDRRSAQYRSFKVLQAYTYRDLSSQHLPKRLGSEFVAPTFAI